ncbi:MAG: SIMPL domain-containing protein [Prolixibacteraceae bacterium]|nr:SIMPL domain-containing protein [Prolixibacteraceae bacterium]MBN2775686.1 SIMPL domain-containing protein [Prolixibacteraceae bacterium]
MKTIFYFILMFFPFLLSAQTGNKNFIDLNYIEVTGQAEMEVIPDEIYLNIFLNEKDSKGKENLEELEKEMIKKLEKIGIDVSKDLSISDFASNFKNYWLRDNKIFTSKQYQLITHDGATTGKVFKELESIGISNISIEKVDHSKIEDFKKEVKIKAMVAAKYKAGSLAEAIDQEVGKAIYIQELNNNVYPRMMEKVSNIVIRGVSTLSNESAPPDIEFEKINLEYSILARFELK